jgi:hypothetical protein
MSKYQKALDEIKASYQPSGSYSFPNSYYLKEQIDTLQELIDKYVNLLDYIDRFD